MRRVPDTARRHLPGWLAALALLVPAGAQACPDEGAEPSELRPKQARASVVCLINERRRAHGLDALGQDSRLTRAARRHSASMNTRNYFSHSGPGGDTPVSRIRATGYLAGASSWGVAETIRWGEAGRGSPKAAVGSWMKSPPHRSTLLSWRYRELGVGVVRGSPLGKGARNTAIFTAAFGYRG